MYNCIFNGELYSLFRSNEWTALLFSYYVMQKFQLWRLTTNIPIRWYVCLYDSYIWNYFLASSCLDIFDSRHDQLIIVHIWNSHGLYNQYLLSHMLSYFIYIYSKPNFWISFRSGVQYADIFKSTDRSS